MSNKQKAHSLKITYQQHIISNQQAFNWNRAKQDSHYTFINNIISSKKITRSALVDLVESRRVGFCKPERTSVREHLQVPTITQSQPKTVQQL